MKEKRKFINWLCESSVMLAFATVLSMFKAVDLPYGGSVTVCSMIPIVLIAYRYGVCRGLATGLVYGAVQLLIGTGALSYATSWQAAVAIVLLDYIFAFAVIGFAGVFRAKSGSGQMSALIAGTTLACILRYVLHVISGCTVWAGVSVPSADGLVYSLIYNATYMLPETIVCLIGMWYLAKTVDFGGAKLTAVKRNRPVSKVVAMLTSAATLIFAGALVYDTAAVFGVLQNAETGEFDITGISRAPWATMAVVTALAAVVLAVALVISRRKRSV